MKLIEEFRTKVLNSQGSFVIIEPEKNGGKIFYFVQGNVGKARYVYGCQGYKNINFYSDISRELELLVVGRGSFILGLVKVLSGERNVLLEVFYWI